MRKTIISLFFLLSLFSQSATAENYLTLFGYNIGMNFSDALGVRVFDSYIDASNNRENPGIGVGIVNRFAAGSIDFQYLVRFKKGKVYNVSGFFDSGDFDLLLSALEGKYGKGIRSESVLQNKMGAKFDQTEVKWAENGTLLFLSKYGDNLESGKINLISDEAIDDQIEKHKKDKEAIINAI